MEVTSGGDVFIAENDVCVSCNKCFVSWIAATGACSDEAIMLFSQTGMLVYTNNKFGTFDGTMHFAMSYHDLAPLFAKKYIDGGRMVRMIKFTLDRIAPTDFSISDISGTPYRCRTAPVVSGGKLRGCIATARRPGGNFIIIDGIPGKADQDTPFTHEDALP